MARRTTPTPETPSRPRVEGDRAQEIYDATVAVLADVGYDRLTMDAVATEAKASKATLYRRWNGKAELVVDALASMKPALPEPPDTGSLRGDLVAAFCGPGGLTDGHMTTILSSVVTAIGRDPEFAAAFREAFVAPKLSINRAIYLQAAERGELREGLDIDLVTAALPAIVLHRSLLLGDAPDSDLVERIVDQIILPAVTRG